MVKLICKDTLYPGSFFRGITFSLVIPVSSGTGTWPPRPAPWPPSPAPDSAGH